MTKNKSLFIINRILNFQRNVYGCNYVILWILLFCGFCMYINAYLLYLGVYASILQIYFYIFWYKISYKNEDLYLKPFRMRKIFITFIFGQKNFKVTSALPVRPSFHLLPNGSGAGGRGYALVSGFWKLFN